MNYKISILIVFTFFLYSCDQSIINQSKEKNFKIEKKYKNSGFALVYSNKLDLKKLENRSLSIYHKYLKKN